ncbi:hypothetical protein ZWY2020_038948 [Hordeum vulgare]|nr:hypothetical protein ZWY2020_038948 [Hordeum vulgare]
MDSGKYVRYTPDQVEMLERVYADCPKPTSSRRQQLLRECPILANIVARQIKVLFQNRRKVSAMNKLLMEENERLQKQVSQLVHENAQVRQQLQNTSMADDTSCESNLTTPQNPIRDASNPSGLLSIAEETLTEFLSKATRTAIEWVQMPGMKVGIVAISHGCRGVAARACGLVNLEPTKVVEILKDRPSWFRDCRSLEVFTVLPGANGGTIELVYTQLYAPTTLVPARDFWTLRYTTIVEDGSLVVCERSLSGSGGGPSAASAQQFVRAEMLPSGYLVRPCDGGGSIVHIVDHLEFEAWNIPEVLRPLYESSRVVAQKMTTAALRHIRQIAQERRLSRYGEAMVGPDSDKWLEAMKSERESIFDQSFWVYTRFIRNLYFQRSEWEHYRIFDKYMWLTYWFEADSSPPSLLYILEVLRVFETQLCHDSPTTYLHGFSSRSIVGSKRLGPTLQMQLTRLDFLFIQPALAVPGSREVLLMYITATSQVVSTVLTVEREEAGKAYKVQRPIYYISEVLTPSKQRYLHYKKLVYSIYVVVKKVVHSSKITQSHLSAMPPCQKSCTTQTPLAEWPNGIHGEQFLGYQVPKGNNLLKLHFHVSPEVSPARSSCRSSRLDLLKFRLAVIKGGIINGEIIHENLNNLFTKVREYSHHTSLKAGRCIAQAKRHASISEGTEGACEGGFLLIRLCNRYLRET